MPEKTLFLQKKAEVLTRKKSRKAFTTAVNAIRGYCTITIAVPTEKKVKIRPIRQNNPKVGKKVGKLA